MRRQILALLVVLYLVALDSWFFHLNAPANALRVGIVTVVPLLLLLPVPRPPKLVAWFATSALVVAIWALVLTALKTPAITPLVTVVATFWPVIFLVGISSCLRDEDTRYHVLRTFFWLSSAVAVQVTSVFMLTMTGRTPGLSSVALIGKPNVMRTYGLFGFSEGTSGIGSGYSLYRAQSWWGEPSALALWLAAALGAGLWLAQHQTAPRLKRRYKRLTLVVGAAFVLTFSTAALVGAAVAGIVWLTTKALRRSNVVSRSVAITVLVVLLALFFPLAIRGMNQLSYREDRLAFAIGKSPANVGVKRSVAAASINYVMDHPEGLGWLPISDLRGGDLDEATSSAPAFWFLRLGVIGLFPIAFFVAFIAQLVVRGMATSRYMALGVATAAVHQVGFGIWLAGSFLLILAVLAIEDEQVQHDRVRPNRQCAVSESLAPIVDQ